MAFTPTIKGKSAALRTDIHVPSYRVRRGEYLVMRTAVTAPKHVRTTNARPHRLLHRADRRAHHEVAAYYVVTAALTNAAKHAHASVVHVDTDAVGCALRLRIRDDGADGADPVRGTGLIRLINRVEALGGTITVQSPADAGTSLDVEIPLVGWPGTGELRPGAASTWPASWSGTVGAAAPR